MRYIDPSAVPNQFFTYDNGGYVLQFTLQFFRGVMYVSVYDLRANRDIVVSQRLVQDGFILPKFVENGRGNFMVITENGKYPDYNDFGRSCRIVHYYQDEVEEMRR